MKIPEEIEEHQGKYKEGKWATYTEEEFRWWVHLLTQRALHRSSLEKKRKDLIDARNYLLMWIEVTND